MTLSVYGMNGCTTVRKAQKWLDEHGVEHDYYRYEKLDNLADTLDALIDASDLTQVLNPASQAFRKLEDSAQQTLLSNRAAAVQAMAENPRLAKRPIAFDGSRVLSGFNEAQWSEALL